MLSLKLDALIALSRIILFAPLVALLLAWFFMVFGEKFKQSVSWLGWSTRILSGVSLACSILVAMGPTKAFPLTFTFIVDFYLDALSIYFLLLVNMVAFFASWYTVNFLRDTHNQRDYNPEFFHFFFNAFHFTMLVVPMVDNLVVLWVAIELTTVASTLLVYYRRQRQTLEAAWKYIIITTAGIVFALFGTILLSDAINDNACAAMASVSLQSATTCTQLQNIDIMRWSLLGQKEIAQHLDSKLVVLSFLFVLVGYGTKAGLAPMHTWLPDGHGEAPSPVSALLSGVLLKSALFAILRFYTITNLNQGNATFTSNILLFVGLLSLVLATPFILKPNKFKRILAYHSLEHMGIIVFGIGIGGPVALFGALLHVLNHALTKALMFLTFGNIRRAYANQIGVSELDEKQITGALKNMPLSSIVLLLGGLGLVGSPPFNIFLSEFIILWAAFDQATHTANPAIPILAVALFLITITLIFGGLVGHLARLLLGRPPVNIHPQDNLRQLMPLVLLLVIIILFGFWIPTWPLDFPQLLNQSVCILQNGAGDVCQP